MIESLLIQNFAIIDQLEIEFLNNMTVLTGETGAGKSIIIDAIGQLLGNRTQLGFIKSGCQKAFIEGVFNIENNVEVRQRLEEYDFEYDEKLVVSKSFQTDGKTVIKMNYRTVSQSILKTIMPLLVDIHSQFETHSLFDEANHKCILDGFIGESVQTLLQEYRSVYHAYKGIQQEYDKVVKEELSDEQLDFYQAQLAEINELDLDTIEEEELEQEKKALQNFEKTNEKITKYMQYMNSDRGVLANLDSALHALEAVSDIEEYKETYNQLYDAYYSIMDIHETIKDTFNSANFDEYRLQELQDLLFKITRLKRKYGPSIDAIKEAREDLLKKIEAFENRDAYIAELEKQKQELHTQSLQLANKITMLRQKKALIFSKLIKKELADLYLPKVQFEVSFQETNLDSNGKDKIIFMISTNAGQTLKPLSKVSSGGELSRIMLAIKVLSLQYSSISTIIFDEADTGVSGKVAESIGQKMKEIASVKQVLCITHLSQVAAFACQHYVIEKTNNKNTTSVTIKHLNEEQSIMELAKMISGKEVSEESIKHATHLKQQNKV